MQTIRYTHFPGHLSTAQIALFKNVKNAAQLRRRLIQAATMAGLEGETEREAVNFAFVDARLITSILHLQTAIYHAILAQVQGSLRTKTANSEVLWNLNPTNNISEAIRRYGVSDDCEALFVVRIIDPIPNAEDRMKAVVKGDVSPLDHLECITDWSNVKKYNKLNNEYGIKEAGGDNIKERVIINEVVTSMVAMKSVSA